MRTVTCGFLVVLALSTICIGGAQDDAMTLAQKVLDKGAATFDKRNASEMADQFLDHAEIVLLKRDPDSNQLETQSYKGRSVIEKGYADVFKDRLPEHRSRNTVEFARFLGKKKDMLLIHGRFSMNVEQGDTCHFVQTRIREGDQWKVFSMQLTELPANP